MTLATDVVTFIGNNADATSLDGSVSENLFAASVEHYKVRQALGIEGLQNLIPTRVGQSYGPVVRSSTNGVVTLDTDWFVFASVTVPAGLMGLDSKLIIIADWTYTNSASVKSLALDWGGSNVAAPTYTTTAGVKLMMEVLNAHSLTAQRILNSSTFNAATAAAHTSVAKDTGSPVVIDLKAKWGANVASENITLLGYSIWHYPG